MGSFLAALRKSKGYTQRDVADSLNVSDKTVSKWERNESAPDLALIPALAELYEVTCDEILRGQRLAQPDHAPVKAERQLKWLMESSLTRFKSSSGIAFAITAIGIIALFVCSYGFYKAILGFGLALSFFTVSLMLTFILVIRALAAINSEEFESEAVYRYCKTVWQYLLALVYTNVAAIVCSIPFVALRDRYFTDSVIGFGYYLLLLPLCFAVTIVLHTIITEPLLRIAIKSTAFKLKGQDVEIIRKANRLKGKAIGMVTLAILVTLLGQSIFNSFSATDFSSGQRFEDFESFKAFIETPVEDSNYFPDIYFEDEDRERTIELVDGDPSTSVRWRNKSVRRIDYERLTVYTDTDLAKGDFVIQVVNIVFLCLYLTETLLSAIFYHKKKKRLCSGV